MSKPSPRQSIAPGRLELGKTYYWLTGYFRNHEPEAEDTDEWALQNGFVSVVPVTTDMTAHGFIDTLKIKF